MEQVHTSDMDSGSSDSDLTLFSVVGQAVQGQVELMSALITMYCNVEQIRLITKGSLLYLRSLNSNSHQGKERCNEEENTSGCQNKLVWLHFLYKKVCVHYPNCFI